VFLLTNYTGIIMADVVSRDFAMSYADLIGICNNISNCIDRDAAEFLTYGVNSAAVTAFDSKISAFQALPTDIELASNMINATQTKNTIASELKVMLKPFTTRAKLVYGENSGTYNRFYLKDISHSNDNDLLVFSQMVSRAAVELLTELATVGLTQDMIDDLDDKNLAFADAIEAQGIAVNSRDDASNNRIKKANELYGLLSRYCEIGKTIWYETNEARYNDYVLYAPSAGSLTAPTGLRFSFSNLAFYWEMVEHASSYQVEASLNGSDYFEMYAGSDLVCAYTPVQEGWMWYRARARNANGFGPYSDVLKQGYYSGIILPPPSNLAVELVSGTTNSLRLSWDEVPSAERYKISKSIVAVGDGVGASGYIGDSTETQYIETVDSGHRYYYHVAAENRNQNSPASSDVFIDVN
jgi:hypothetical protein